MIRLQQYERLLKAMVASMTIQGTLEEFQTVQGQQSAVVSNRTLGALVGTFTANYLVAASSDVEVGPDHETSSGGQSPDVAWARMAFNISMPPERYTQAKDGLADLVALRNDLVHHFIERFDLSDEFGCRDAADHLDSCYEIINDHCLLLNAWATGLAESQALTSAFLNSKAFEDVIVHGINPDGSVCWPRSMIVECLRDAETACKKGGWTSLDAAIDFIATKNRDQVPSRYGCKTWRQVLTQSGQFEFRSIAGSNGARGQAWYRSHAKD